MTPEYCDVVIVGAGISGISAAYHLQKKCPDKRYVILEGRNAIGGTWDLFRYPGIRSDSDMYTFGYRFKPWRNARAIADGPSILEYLHETIRENHIDQQIRLGHRVTRANWSSTDASWNLEVQRQATGEVVRLRCNLLLMCSGYYSYQAGYTPEFKGRETFQGTVVHPQHWPADLDYRDKRVIVIGSGATAMTLVPAIATDVKHVVMLQRSPTYVVSLPARDRVAQLLRLFLPETIAHALVRWKNIFLQQFFYHRMRKYPEVARKKLIDRIRLELGPDYDVERHFTPKYNPWDQRLCVVPDGDLFQALKSGKASIVTDQIDCFTPTGVQLKSGTTLEADIIITATGLNLIRLGNVTFSIDGEPVDFPNTFTYKGVMFSNVPNLIYTFGYINASWTLRADLTSEFACRLIQHMDKLGVRQCTPRLREEDLGMSPRPFIEHFTPGYIQRSIHLMPKQGDREPWLNPQTYPDDKKRLRWGRIDDGVLQFSHPEKAE